MEDSGGVLGDGTTANSEVPIAVSGLSGVTAISINVFDSLAIAPPPGVHWYKNSVEVLQDGPHVTVSTKGALTLHAPWGEAKCKLTDHEEIWNPIAEDAGEDAVTAFTLSHCKSKAEICRHGKLEIISKGPTVAVTFGTRPAD